MSTAASRSRTWEAAGQFPASRQEFDWLDRAAFAYLALPVLIFPCGWLKWWAGIPLAALLLAESREFWTARSSGDPAHYATRLTGSAIERMLKPAVDVNFRDKTSDPNPHGPRNEV